MSNLIAPSILSANFAHLGQAIEMINESEADWIHFDVMDGVFVPNISFGLTVLKDISPIAKKFLDVHLMIVEPERYIDAFAKAGAQQLTIHIEACVHLHSAIQQIHKAGMKAGIAINPHTPVHFLEDILQDIDTVCLMSVNPGFGGQKFIKHTYHKLHRLKAMINAIGASTLIEVDGGVDMTNAQTLFHGGANVLVAGNSVFGSANPKQAIWELKNIASEITTAQ